MDDENNTSWIRYVKNITVNLGLPFVSVTLIAKLYNLTTKEWNFQIDLENIGSLF